MTLFFFLACFYTFFILILMCSLNQDKIIKWSFRDARCFFVRDENRKSEHLGGTRRFVSGF